MATTKANRVQTEILRARYRYLKMMAHVLADGGTPGTDSQKISFLDAIATQLDSHDDKSDTEALANWFDGLSNGVKNIFLDILRDERITDKSETDSQSADHQTIIDELADV